MPNASSSAVVARLFSPTVEERTRVAVLSDTHVSPRAEGTPMVYHRSADRLRTALADAERRGVDAVVSPGDLTKDGAPWEYDLLDEVLGEFDVRFFGVPGNHDVPKASADEYEYGDEHDPTPVEEFARKYGPTDEFPFVESVGGVDFLGLNTATRPDGSLRRSHDGAVTEADLAWLEDAVTAADTPVVLMHHNTTPMYDQLRAHRDAVQPEMGLPPLVRDPEPLMTTLTDLEVPLVVTGHLHNVGVAEAGPVREVTTPATGSFPQSYLLFEFGPEGTIVRYVPVADVDGMTEAHHERVAGGETSAGYTSFAAVRLARLPLVDEFDD
jgi:3',5'-cyclic AMP phosphodiesterase CpdA